MPLRLDGGGLFHDWRGLAARTRGARILPEKREHFGEAARSRFGGFFEAGGDQFFPRRGHGHRRPGRGAHLGDRRGDGLADLHYHVVAGEGRCAGEQRVHEHAEAVDIVARAGALAVNLLRAEECKVRVRTFCDAGAFERVQEHAADSEIRDQQAAVRAQVEVRGREVAVEKLDAVCIRERLGELRDPRLDVCGVEPAFLFQHLIERLALKFIHRDRRDGAVLHEIIDAENVRVDELAVALHLLAKFGHRTRIARDRAGHKVERHIFPEHLVGRDPHGACAGLAQVAAEHVAAADFYPFSESCFGVRCHWRLFVRW